MKDLSNVGTAWFFVAVSYITTKNTLEYLLRLALHIIKDALSTAQKPQIIIFMKRGSELVLVSPSRCQEYFGFWLSDLVTTHHAKYTAKLQLST